METNMFDTKRRASVRNLGHSVAVALAFTTVFAIVIAGLVR